VKKQRRNNAKAAHCGISAQKKEVIVRKRKSDFF
jgi:hypothetical protein